MKKARTITLADFTSKTDIDEIDPVFSNDTKIDEVKTEGSWEVVTVKLDSGAFDWVFTPQAANAFELKATHGSENGHHFQAANGTKIANYGKRTIKGMPDKFVPIETDVQVAEVKRNLGSAIKMVREGNGVWLSVDEYGKSNSHVVNKATGQKLDVDIVDDNFEIKLWVPRAKPVAEVKKSGIIRYNV